MSEHRAPTKTFIPSPKVRRWIYGIGLTSAPLLVAYGLVEADKVPLWVSFFGVFLGVSNAVALGNVNEDKE